MSKDISYNQIKKNDMINHYIDKANFVTGAMGFTEHSRAHAALVAETAGNILRKLNFSKKEIELAKIAGYMHDIGNTINRNDHAHSGAVMAFQILTNMGVYYKDVATICSAIGQHDEKTGTAIDPISAALILADKTDVRRNRVCTKKKSDFDIHDRVNYAVTSSNLTIIPEKKTVQLDLTLDYNICTVMDYFEIFLGRMLMCKRAAEILGLKFKARANGTKVC
ncbi:MAG: HD domain-containing protein [Clostridia bacterium]|nr:HD domain-containing protein [Clostridia bacterium]